MRRMFLKLLALHPTAWRNTRCICLAAVVGHRDAARFDAEASPFLTADSPVRVVELFGKEVLPAVRTTP